ncbi:MAG: hypothetical protein AAFU85_19000 [Planctomycetota bacterium]
MMEVTKSAVQIFELLPWIRGNAWLAVQLHKKDAATLGLGPLPRCATEQLGMLTKVVVSRRDLKRGIQSRLPELSAAVQAANLPHPAAIPIDKTCAHEYAMDVAQEVLLGFSEAVRHGSDWCFSVDLDAVLPLGELAEFSQRVGAGDDQQAEFVLESLVDSISDNLDYTLLKGMANQEGGAFINHLPPVASSIVDATGKQYQDRTWAKCFDTSVRTIGRWRSEDGFPPSPCTLIAVQKWAEQHKKTMTSLPD